MKAHRKRKKWSITHKIVIIVVLIMILTVFLISFYTRKTSAKMVEIAKIKLEKFTSNFLSNNIGYQVLNDSNIDNILVINKNKAGEILYVDYNLDRAYEALEKITDILYEKIDDLENGKFGNIKDNDIIKTDKALGLKLPLLIGSNSPLWANLGPKIYVKFAFTGVILTNIKSKITNYGFNNALVELFVTIKINEEITTPVVNEEVVIDYDVLVASKVINGRVPEFYGGLINEESSNLDIPLN